MRRKLDRRRGALIALACALLAAAAVPIAASSSPRAASDRFYLAMHLHPTGPTSTAGTFVSSGAVADSGTVDVQNLSIVPIAGADAGRLSGDETYFGQQGTIVTHFEGTAFPLSSPHETGRGTFTIVSGTGAYSGLRGGGSFLIVVDLAAGELTGVEVGDIGDRGRRAR
jgi:hypothetical protein